MKNIINYIKECSIDIIEIHMRLLNERTKLYKMLGRDAYA